MLDQLATLNPDGTPPKTRISSAEKAYQIWNTLRMADSQSAAERATHDAMYDNARPLNQNQLDVNGQSYRVNVSWGLAPMVLEMAQSGYIDMIRSIQTLFTCPSKVTNLDPQRKQEAEGIVAEKISQMIRQWPDFMPTFLRLTSTFIKHAVSFATFDDEWDWRFDAKGMSDFKIPRKTKVGQENIDVACWLRFYSMSQLYQYIKHPDVAKANGWDVEVVKKVIMQAINNANTFGQWKFYEWEKLEVELRNNDYFWTYGVAQTQSIRVVHMVWQEFDGSLSYGAVTDNQESKDWLCHKIGRYASTYNAFIAFTYGVGNDYYHGIRGQGYVIFPIVGALNRAYGQFLETAMFGSTPILQPKDESVMASMQFTPMGPFSLISPGVDVLANTMTPNASTGFLTVINAFTNMFREQTANANTQALMSSNKEMTKAEVDARLGTIAKMSNTSQSLFGAPWSLTLREMVRRIIRKDYTELEPGGKYIVQLKADLLKIGGEELLDVFYNLDVDKLEASSAIGAGSEAARQLALNQLVPLMQYYPESGRKNLVYDITANLVTFQNANRYAGVGGSPSLTNQELVAYSQNSLLMLGQFQPVIPDEDLFVHARVHAEMLPIATQQADQAIAQAAEAVGSGQPFDLTPAMNAIQGLGMLNSHLAETVERIAVNPQGQQMVGPYKQLLQQADEVVYNGSEQLQSMIEKQSQAQLSEAEQTALGPDPAVIAKIESQQALTSEKIKSLQAKTEADIQIKQARADQDMAINDAKNAQDVTNTAMKNRQQRRKPQPA